MKRKQLEKMAEALGLQIDTANAMEKLIAKEESGYFARWTVRKPGFSAGRQFGTLDDVYNFLMIEKGGQEL